ncbi:unnamed protein product [Prorocentrum cordatum]|uniref:ubiquitinyl hydrolase 1 n=1 Tax=Prorocentrum cordatum TaxID=2364126 RepID=A0ABN9WM70_9DINO|nr:unnamed protein product [Polarella glacialis]
MRWFGRYSPDEKALSRASPAVLAGCADLKSEDDVLFLERLPSFNGTLGPTDSELLLTYLTAPYLRVPLLLGFFAERHRISLLREPQLQAILDAALFEPGPWQSERDEAKGPPTMVPAPDRSHLGTPAGLLFNELLKAPGPVLEALLCMLRVAVEKDAGRPDSANEGLILYLVRLAVRVEAYLAFLLERGGHGETAGRSGAGPLAFLRGLAGAASERLQAELQAARAALRRELQGDVLHMLRGWVSYAAVASRRARLLPAACRAHAHLALLFRSVAPEKLGAQEVSRCLSAQVFLGFNHRWQDTDSKDAEDRLGVGEVELFEAFEAKRSGLTQWLRDRAGPEADEVLDQVEQVVTLPSGTEAGAASPEAPVTPSAQAKRWVEAGSQQGDFVPSREAAPPGWFKPRPEEAFRPWMKRVTQGPPGSSRQVSLNLGQYGSRQEGLELLPVWVLRSEDYVQAFGRTDAHCVEREVATERVWKELVGHGHSLQLWEPDTRGLSGDAMAQPWLSDRRYGPSELRRDEAWVRDILEPIRASVPSIGDIPLYVKGRIPNGPDAEVTLMGVVGDDGRGSHPAGQLKEIRVQRSPALVEVYNVVEYGRQFYRTLVFTSNAMWSFYTPSTGELLLYSASTSSSTLAAGEAGAVAEAARSVLVLRRLDDRLSKQLHVPARFLRGLLPECLLERYTFWRCEAGSLAGCIVGDERDGACDSPTRVTLSIKRAKDGVAAAATIRRCALVAPPEHVGPRGRVPIALWPEDPASKPGVLVNLQRGAHKLMHLLARLDNLSHVLAWTSDDGGGLLRVEFPRLRLSFTRRNDQLHCDQHRGFWLMDRTCLAATERLLAHWGGGTLLLVNVAGEMIVLASAVAEPIRPRLGDFGEGLLPCRLVLRRGDPGWVSNLEEGCRHYYYRVHPAGTFALAPTLAAGLYLLLCRFFTWHFAEIVAMARTVSEVASSEERQLWDRLHLLAAAPYHADAVACCLHLADATAPFTAEEPDAVSWDLRRLLLEYVRKRHLVSADCALPRERELALLDSLLQGASSQAVSLEHPVELAARRVVLQAMLREASEGGARAASSLQVSVPNHLGPGTADAGFDRVVDRSFTEDARLLEKISATVQDVAYSRPEASNMQGTEAIGFLDDLLSPGAILTSVPFALLYELFTKTLRVEVVVGDDGAALASILLRVVAQGATKSTSTSVLRALELNPGVCDQMPKWGSGDLSWSFGIGRFTFDKASSSKLQKAACQTLRQLQGSLAWPRDFGSVPSAASEVVVAADVDHIRHWTAPLTADVRCARRAFGARQGVEFGGRPLEALASRYAVVEREEKSGPAQGALDTQRALEQLSKDPRLQSPICRHSLERLLHDLQLVNSSPTAQVHLGPPQKLAERAASLSTELADLWEQDAQQVQEMVPLVVEVAHSGSALATLQRKGGYLTFVTFNSLIALLMAEEPDATRALQKVNATMSDEEVTTLFEKVATVLCHTVRMGQISRAQQALRDLLDELHSGSGELALGLRAQAAAQQLCLGRHCASAAAEDGNPAARLQRLVRGRGSSSGSDAVQVCYEPRLLVFEFLFNVLLRKSQVKLLDTFMRSAESGKSVCHQMIMGEGKTTVIAPLLTLLLADGSRLLCACMPASLLDMSRSAMIERFSSPVLPRPVLTLRFHRQTLVSSSLCAKLEAAQCSRAAVVAAPASIKSVLLRQVELILSLGELRKLRLAADAGAAERAFFRLPAWLGGSKGGSSPEQFGGLVNRQEKARAEEVRVCGRILALFHRGVLLLDEVDLLLDPLKSELNWPLGQKVPLDLTDMGAAARKQQGFRYRLPFFLLDAVLAAAAGQPESAVFAARRKAQEALVLLTQRIRAGRRELLLQTSPHLVLFSREHYARELLPPLADWTAPYVEAHLEGALGSVDLHRLLKLREPDESTRQALRGASELARKIINLAISWLHTLLPYILSRVHRVSYGLLTGSHLESARAGGGCPLSRRLLAVPFVGKDVPSASSEFSHPDVTIGFTIMAYRMNGLRQADAHMLLRVLLDEMRAESTVRYHRRAACRAYVDMVTRAGGVVRGFTEDGRWMADLQDEEQRRRRDALARSASQRGAAAEEGQRRGLWPLELLDLADPEQMDVLFGLLGRSALAVQYLLEHYTFLAGTLERHESQLSASGQELAGPQLFGRCLGFSGTPNNLLPKPMGLCAYARGDDGRVLSTLSNASVVSVRELGPWSPQSLLDEVAAATNGAGGPRYQALIDTGALITGMTNFEVAKYRRQGPRRDGRRPLLERAGRKDGA